MIKAVIFDMDGLLIDTEMISYQCYKQLIESYGFTFTLNDYIRDYPGRQLNASLQFIKDYYHLDFSIEEKTDDFHNLEEKYIQQDGAKLKQGAKELLEYLHTHHYKIALATSSGPSRAYKLLQDHQILHYFDTTVYGKDVIHGKPHPDIFLEACKRLDVLPDEAIVLEDSEAGIQASYSAKIPVYCIPDLKSPRETYKEMTNDILESLKDVIVILENKK